MRSRLNGLKFFPTPCPGTRLRLAGALIALVLAGMSASSPLLLAQGFSSLRGTVTDPQGGVVPGADVILSNADNSLTRSAFSDSSGSFRFEQVPPGTYTLRVAMDGFKTEVRAGLQLLVNTPATLDVGLSVGSISQVISVEASATILNTEDATRGNAILEREVKDLPFVARNPINLLTVQPGVAFTGESDTDLLFLGSNQDLDDREGAVNGIRGNQTNVSLDGADANDFESQAAFSVVLPVTLDSVQEFRVVTANANATDGIAGGAQVALVTKSGTNDLHGNVRYYHRNTATSANSFFNNSVGIDRPGLLRHIYGGSLGGPIVKNRAFFFLDYEGRRDSSESTQIRLVPTQSLREGRMRYRTEQGEIATLTPEELQAIDPLGLGVNPAMLAYMTQYPEGNDSSISPDGGLNVDGFRFNAPIEVGNAIYTARFDFLLDEAGRHSVFWRGTLGDLKTDLEPAQFPGLEASSILLNNSKGFATGYTAQINSNLINTIRWGFTRQGVEQTGAQGDFFAVNHFTPVFPGAGAGVGFPERAQRRLVPVHRIEDNLTWLKGDHTIQMGVVFHRSRNERRSDENTAATFVIGTDIDRRPFDALLQDSDPNNDPTSFSEFRAGFESLTGAIGSANSFFLADPVSGQFLQPGSPRERRFAQDGIELFIQDSWKVRPNLTLTAGLRYSYFTPIWETEGQMVRPTVDVRDWWNQRQTDMDSGIPSDVSPLLSFAPAGRANDAEPLYEGDFNNFAPRIALAWSPQSKAPWAKWLLGRKSVIRAGFGVYFQRMGGALAITNDQFGSPGISSRFFSERGIDYETAPRFSGQCGIEGCTGLPAISEFLSPPSQAAFPFTPPTNGSGFDFLVDNRLKNPYTLNAALSFQRELPGRISLDVGYVGTFGRQQLIKVDLSQYYGNFRDPGSGQLLWNVYNQLVDLIGPDPFNPALNPNDSAALATIAPIAFFENLLPNLPQFLGRDGLSPTQAFYALAAEVGPSWSDALFAIDRGLTPGQSPWAASVDPDQDGFVLWQRQYQALPAWFNFGSSNYHSLQVSARRRAGSAQFAFNYVFSKSLDNGSASENATFDSGILFALPGLIPNAFRTKAHFARSDFDIRHNFNTHWVVDLPFGKGKRWGSAMKGPLDQIVGGWALTGVVRWRSGFPISVDNGFFFPTDFFIEGPATVQRPVDSRITSSDPNGRPNLFSDPEAARNSFGFTRPGEVGSRASISGPRYFSADLGLHKRFSLPWSESHRLEFRINAFNVFNHVNFALDNNEVELLDISSPSNFGRIQRTAGPRGGAREVEFALRYAF